MFLPIHSVPNVDFGANYRVFCTFYVILNELCMILYEFTWFWIDFEGKSMKMNEKQ